MIIAQAKRHGVPEKLVRRIVMRESRYNPRARNHSFWGLMQISYPTARSMGFKGSPEQLLNPLVNLTYAVPYLANAFVIAGRQEDAAVRLYAAGYYNAARSRGLLGALRTADSRPLTPSEQADLQMAMAQSAADQQSVGAFGALTQPVAPPPVIVAAAQPEHKPATLPEGKATTGGTTMLVDKKGEAAPPKKWTHDGGVTRIAMGDQPVEQIAAYGQPPGVEAKAGTTPAHGKAKSTMFAAIYKAPTTAQAYAATPDAQEPGLTQAPAQTAISQMAAGAPDAPRGETQPADAPTPRKRHAKVTRKPKHGETAVAETDDDAKAPATASKATRKAHASNKKGQTVAARGSEPDSAAPAADPAR